MQLFIIDKDPCKAASALADCHVRKQILETAQILTAYWVNSGYKRLDWMPRPQSYNHPVAKAITLENAGWVLTHFDALLSEYIFRFEKTHSYDKLYSFYLHRFTFHKLLSHYKNCEIESFHRMFSGFTPEPGDIVSEYRQYYRWKSTQIKDFRYTGVKPPEWLEVGKCAREKNTRSGRFSGTTARRFNAC